MISFTRKRVIEIAKVVDMEEEVEEVEEGTEEAAPTAEGTETVAAVATAATEGMRAGGGAAAPRSTCGAFPTEPARGRLPIG